MINLSDSNYSYLEQISTVPKMFEPLKFDCIHHMQPLRASAPMQDGTNLLSYKHAALH